MNTKFNLILSIIAVLSLLVGCVDSSKPKTAATVEYAKPVHVNKKLVKRRVYSNGTDASSQVGVIKPYKEAPSTTTVSSRQPVPYVPEDSTTVSNTTVVNQSADTYTVKSGDTLYSIAFRYGKDYRQLASNNGIESPYNITVGQVLQLNKATVSSLKKESAKPKFYIVQPGDTAVSVAKKNNLTLSQLVKANNLKRPYNLKTGQKLSLVDQKGQHFEDLTTPTVVPVAKATKTTNTTNTQTLETPELVPASVNTSEPVKVVSGKTKTAQGVTWMWPAKGRVIHNFSNENKGIDIAGSRGQNVVAASAGQVVYSGNALRGYGNLIIINHNNQYLSAYAHNDMLLVKEGQKVKRGQVIAKMGSTDASQVMLHFEIRYKGNSVNPRKYLP